MLPQSCKDIHSPLSHELMLNNKNIESSKNLSLFNNVCCLDYLINIEEYYSDNMLEIIFYKKFIKLIYELDKNNRLDFPNYNKESLIKFIILLNKTSCYYYTHLKIKYSKYLCNLCIKTCQIIFQSENDNANPINQYQNNGQFPKEINIKNLISDIYNNACCNYLKTFSFNKCLKFMEYSYKNIDDNDINNKMIYYNNSIIVSTKNIINYDNINNSIKTLEQLIHTRKNYFNNIYCDKSYCNNGDNSEIIKAKLETNKENYKSFKLLCFIMYNYVLFVENIFKEKEKAKNLFKINYEYVCTFLGRTSFEAQKFLIRLNDKIKNKRLNYKIYEDNKKIKSKSNNNYRHSEHDINLRINNILERIEEFEGILHNEKILNIIKEKNLNNEKISKNNNNNNEIVNTNYNLLEEKNTNNKININNAENFIKKGNDNINKIINKENKKEKENINPQKKEKERITFDMMDNIIEEFKKESQEKLEANKKLKEEQDKKKLDNINKENNNINLTKTNSENLNPNDNSVPKKPPRIKKLFQKVLGHCHRGTKQTQLGELFQSLMGSKTEDKKEENDIKIEDKKDEIKVGKEKENNFINLDDDNESKNSDEDNNKENNKENENKINDNSNSSQNCGFGFKININLDPSSYSYDATTLYQEIEN